MYILEEKVDILFKAVEGAPDSEELMHIELKETFFQSELRMSVGLPRRSWYSCQMTKHTRRVPEIVKYAIVEALRALFTLPAMVLGTVS